jgi:hypothetical protein
MNIIVFSKDRAMQLELFIRSFNIYVKNPDKYWIKILYTYSDDKFKNGYEKLISESNGDILWKKEENFKSDLINLINQYDAFTVFFVDDIIFKNTIDFDDKQKEIFEQDNEILCRSLRLQPDLTHSYASKTNMVNPMFLDNNIYLWKGESGDYGYPMSVDGHIFRTNQIFPYVLNLPYTNPNSFEGNMAIRPINLPKMICYDKSIIINNPCNKVQTNNPNYHGIIDVRELNKKFLDGFIISLENIDGLKNNACHQEIDLIFKNKNKKNVT